MTDLELKKLQLILKQMKRSKSWAKVAYRDYFNVYQWGLHDGLEMALELLTPFYDEMFKTYTRENQPIE